MERPPKAPPSRKEREKGRAPAFVCGESMGQPAVCFRPRCQLSLRASRNTRLSGWKPAAMSMVRANLRKSGQRDAIPTRASEGAGSHPARDEETERICRVSNSVPSRRACRTIRVLLGSTTGMAPSRAPGIWRSCKPQLLTGNVTACWISVATIFSQFFIRLDQQEMIGRLRLKPLAETCAQGGQGSAEFAGRAHELGNQLIECERRWQFGLTVPNVDPAATAELNPTLPFQLPVARADGVGMEAKAPRQFPGTGQALPGRQIVAQNTEHDLGYKLLADRNSTFAGKPKLHGAGRA
jgi:hypothetical protein